MLQPMDAWLNKAFKKSLRSEWMATEDKAILKSKHFKKANLVTAENLVKHTVGD